MAEKTGTSKSDRQRIKVDDKTKLVQHGAEVETSVNLVAFLAAISFFFSGLLLTGDISNSAGKSVSLSLLFASAFGFLFSALFYSNSSGKYSVGIIDKEQVAQGNIISEYFGVYGLIFATPLAVFSYSGDLFMSVVVMCLVSAGMIAYQIIAKDASILERYFDFKKTVLISALLVGTVALQLLFAFLEINVLVYVATAVLWTTIIVLTVLSWRAQATEEREG